MFLRFEEDRGQLHSKRYVIKPLKVLNISNFRKIKARRTIIWQLFFVGVNLAFHTAGEKLSVGL